MITLLYLNKMEKIRIKELEGGQKLFDYKKEGNELHLKLEGGWFIASCSNCGDTKATLNRDLRECMNCGNREILVLKK